MSKYAIGLFSAICLVLAGIALFRSIDDSKSIVQPDYVWSVDSGSQITLSNIPPETVPWPTPTATLQTVTESPTLPVGTVEAASAATTSHATQGDWWSLLSQYDWNVNEAYAVMLCESGGRADAVSRAGAVGLFQIHPYNEANFDPATNVAAAYRKWLDGLKRGNRWWHWNQWGSCGHF